MAEEEEQVVGVVQYCDVCEERTVHVDGVCRDHKVVRRRRAVAALSDEPDQAPRAARRSAPTAAARSAPRAEGGVPLRKRKRKPEPKSGSGSRILGFLLLGAAVFGMGEVHIVRGKDGTHLCRKDGWSLSHTLVNIDELRASKTPDAALLRAIDKCQLPLATPPPSK